MRYITYFIIMFVMCIYMYIYIYIVLNMRYIILLCVWCASAARLPNFAYWQLHAVLPRGRSGAVKSCCTAGQVDAGAIADGAVARHALHTFLGVLRSGQAWHALVALVHTHRERSRAVHRLCS